MTNEEIQKHVERAFEIAETYGSDYQAKDMTEFLRALVSQAYEEAARIAENPYGDEVQAMASDEPKAVGQKIGAALRTLKDSLVAKPVS